MQGQLLHLLIIVKDHGTIELTNIFRIYRDIEWETIIRGNQVLVIGYERMFRDFRTNKSMTIIRSDQEAEARLIAKPNDPRLKDLGTGRACRPRQRS